MYVHVKYVESFLLLFSSKVTEEKMEVYTVVCKQLESRDLKACLLHDLGVSLSLI